MIAKSITSAPFSDVKTAPQRSAVLTSMFFKIVKPLFLLLLLPGLLLSAAKAIPATGATITLNGGQLVNVFSSDDFTVTFSTAQTGLTASNFTVTGTVTGAFVSNVTGSGTSWTVTVTIPGSFQSQGTFTLNLANATNLSPGLSGLPIAGPTVQVIKYPVDGTFSLSSSNANSGYAKTGDKINFTLQSAHYDVENWGVNIAGQNASGFSNLSNMATGQVTLGSGTAQGALTWSWNYTNQFNESNSGSGTSGIIFDSVNPTVTISAPSVSSTGTSPVTYTVTYADANFNTSTLSTSNITLNRAGSANGTVTLVENSATNYTVNISNITGAGTLGISIAAGTASDLAGNLAPASSPSTTFNVVPAASTTTSISSSNNPSFSASPGNSVTFTATVTSSSTVNEGTISFTSNGTALTGDGSSTVAVSNGQAAFITNFTAAGSYPILATYNGTADFASSSNSLNQQVTLHPTTISSIMAGSAYSNAGTIQFTVKFGASITGLGTSNFSLTTSSGVSGATVASVSPSSGSTYTVTVNTGTGDGTIGLNFSDASGLTPGISTSLPFTGGTTTIDKTAPTVQSITATSPGNSSPTNTSPLIYTVTFSEDVSGVDANAFTVNTNGANVSQIQVAPISASAYYLSVFADAPSGSGTIQLNLTNGSNITDLAGNTLSNTLNGDTYTIDTSSPYVKSITAATPLNTNPTNATSVTYTVSFSEAVENVSSYDFTATTSGVTTGGISVNQIDNADYSVTVSGISGSGTLRLDVQTAGTATDLAGNYILSAFTGGDVYNIDQSPPVTTVQNYTSTSSAPAGWANSVGDVLIATVSFNEKVQTPVITIGGHTASVVNTTGNTWTGSYTLTANDPEENYIFDVKATDIAGNATEYNSGNDGYLITFDKTPPEVTISNPSTTITQGGPVTYTINFSDTNFKSGSVDPGQITLNVTGSATANVGVDNFGSGATVTLSNITGDGLLGISVYPGTAVDQANNRDIGAGPSTTFIVDNTPPTATISAPSVTQIGTGGSGTVTYTVTYADANLSSTNLTNAGITLNTGGTASGTFNVSGSGASYTITISGITGLGTLGITLAAGFSSDLAGNTDVGSIPSATFNVLSSNAALASMGPQYGPLSPVFSPGNTKYTLTVPNTDKTIWVKPVSADPNATITVNGSTAASGTLSTPVTLTEGAATTITVLVTAQDAGTTKTYTINVTRGPSGNANLASIGSSITPLTPIFSAGTTSYSLSVGNAIQTMTVSPAAADPNAKITVNGNPVASGTLSQSVPLTAGMATPITVIVTAQNGATKTYTITVTRALPNNANLASIGTSTPPFSPFFVPQTTSYTVSVPNATKTMTVTPVAADPLATITVNTATVASGATSDPVTLNEGTTTTVTVVVTAQDGTTKTYKIAVTRAASANNLLASMGPSISPMTPVFSPVKNSYTLSVSNATQTMTVTPVTEDANATITVNTATVASKSTSDPVALTAGGTTPINVTVTAQNGATNTYTIEVTRAPGDDNNFNPGISVTKPTETVTLAEDGIIIHQGISPNGDGVNDFLQIDNISQYPDNKLSIMNRNGQLVYEATAYDNSSKVFDGHSNKNGQMQLPGTYFYQLDYTVNGTARHKTGFVVLKY